MAIVENNDDFASGEDVRKFVASFGGKWVEQQQVEEGLGLPPGVAYNRLYKLADKHRLEVQGRGKNKQYRIPTAPREETQDQKIAKLAEYHKAMGLLLQDLRKSGLH